MAFLLSGDVSSQVAATDKGGEAATSELRFQLAPESSIATLTKARALVLADATGIPYGLPAGEWRHRVLTAPRSFGRTAPTEFRVRSDVNGYAIEGLPVGRQLTIWLFAENSASRRFDVAPTLGGEIRNLGSIVFEAGGQARVQVRFESGAYIAGAWVAAEWNSVAGNEAAKSVKTVRDLVDSSGRCLLQGLLPGSHTLTVGVPGFGEIVVPISVTVDSVPEVVEVVVDDRDASWVTVHGTGRIGQHAAYAMFEQRRSSHSMVLLRGWKVPLNSPFRVSSDPSLGKLLVAAAGHDVAALAQRSAGGRSSIFLNARAALGGRVVSETGRGLAGVPVYMHGDSLGGFSQRVISGAGGAFAFSQAASSDTVNLIASGVCGETWLTLEGAHDSAVQLNVEGELLVLHLKDSEGSPIENAWVEVDGSFASPSRPALSKQALSGNGVALAGQGESTSFGVTGRDGTLALAKELLVNASVIKLFHTDFAPQVIELSAIELTQEKIEVEMSHGQPLRVQVLSQPRDGRAFVDLSSTSNSKLQYRLELDSFGWATLRHAPMGDYIAEIVGDSGSRRVLSTGDQVHTLTPTAASSK